MKNLTAVANPPESGHILIDPRIPDGAYGSLLLYVRVEVRDGKLVSLLPDGVDYALTFVVSEKDERHAEDHLVVQTDMRWHVDRERYPSWPHPEPDETYLRLLTQMGADVRKNTDGGYNVWWGGSIANSFACLADAEHVVRYELEHHDDEVKLSSSKLVDSVMKTIIRVKTITNQLGTSCEFTVGGNRARLASMIEEDLVELMDGQVVRLGPLNDPSDPRRISGWDLSSQHADVVLWRPSDSDDGPITVSSEKWREAVEVAGS